MFLSWLLGKLPKSLELNSRDTKNEVYSFTKMKFIVLSVALTLRVFSEFGFKRIFERLDFELHGMGSPVKEKGVLIIRLLPFFLLGLEENESSSILEIMSLLSFNPSLSIMQYPQQHCLGVHSSKNT